MVPAEIQKLFNFIKYLDDRKVEFMQYIPLCDELIKLNAERFKLNPQSNYQDKFRENEIEAEIAQKIEPITTYIQNPIRNKLIELEIWAGSFTDFSLWNKYYDTISRFKNDFVREDVKQVIKYKQMYLDFRTETNTEFVVLHSIFRGFDQILKELFDFFKDTKADEFQAFENKINVNTLKEAFEHALSSGKPASFTMPNELDYRYGKITDLNVLTREKSQITSIMNTIIHNTGDGALINTGNNSEIKNKVIITKHDFDQLSNALFQNNVENDDVEELRAVIDLDNPDQANKRFGDKVNGWILKMIGKSLNGAWVVGAGAGSDLLANLIGTYYGWK